MPVYVCKTHKNGKQLRFAVPVQVVELMQWQDVNLIVVEVHPNKKIELRSISHGDTKESKD